MLETTNRPPRAISTLQLAVMIFYMVSGGPFGIEETVRAGGACFAILGFAIAPFFWSVPEALVTAELGAAYPEASGTVAWVEEAFGPAAGWLQGCLTWMSGVTDNAIYPVLFLEYAVPAAGGLVMDPWTRFFTLTGICVTLTYINYRGLTVVGNMSLVICALSMSPFVVFCAVGMFKVDPSRWLQMPVSVFDNASTPLDDDTGPGLLAAVTLGGVMWRPYLNNLFWNLNSFDSVACLAGELSDPGRSLPRAMLGGTALVILGYLLPVMVATGAVDSAQSDWVDGYMATVASQVAGPWLGGWVIFAAGISNLALFQGEMSSDAFQILGLAERGYLPKVFAHRSRHGTPTAGLVAGMVVIVVMSMLELSTLIEMLNFNYALSLIMEYAAFVRLRVSKPDLERPYRIPFNTVGCCLLLVPPVGLTVVVMLLASFATYGYAIVTIFMALLIYGLRLPQTIVEYDIVASSETNTHSLDEENPGGKPSSSMELGTKMACSSADGQVNSLKRIVSI